MSTQHPEMATGGSGQEEPIEIKAEEVLAAAGTGFVSPTRGATTSGTAGEKAASPLEFRLGEKQLHLEIYPEPNEEELAAISAAIVTLVQSMQISRSSTRLLLTSSSLRAAAWKAARRPRPTPHLIRGLEPGIAWKLSGLLGKPYGR